MAFSRQKIRISRNQFERELWAKEALAAGIDEVGRGCLAGPVVAAAVIIPKPIKRPFLRDSKVLSEKIREDEFAWIIRNCWFGVGIVHHRAIDRYNIYHASKIAMKRALMALFANYSGTKPIQAILIDAMPMDLSGTAYQAIPVHHYPKGEEWSQSIAAASIVAKVTRDRMMERMDLVFPGYKLGMHKGYCTKEHQDAVKEENHSIIHRMTFLNNPHYGPQKDEFDEQSCLF